MWISFADNWLDRNSPPLVSIMIAPGLMLCASLSLMEEGSSYPHLPLGLGFVAGLIFVYVTNEFLAGSGTLTMRIGSKRKGEGE